MADSSAAPVPAILLSSDFEVSSAYLSFCSTLIFSLARPAAISFFPWVTWSTTAYSEATTDVSAFTRSAATYFYVSSALVAATLSASRTLVSALISAYTSVITLSAYLAAFLATASTLAAPASTVTESSITPFASSLGGYSAGALATVSATSAAPLPSSLDPSATVPVAPASAMLVA